ncbi:MULTISPECIES: hypothetical protein [unclassified Pseudoalteromonas]|uniref:hypothetical protein n=1 Tax=unclassified Pseudoalteromonas TaxID=194690 RepID=UPI003869101B
MDKEKLKPRSRHKQFFKVDETVGLHENFSFRLAIFLPVVIAALIISVFSFQLWLKGQFRFVFSQPEVSAFIKYFTFPISLLSLSIVFGVMVARFHSSKQKAVSNEITLKNNAVNYFYKTHEEFEKYCTKLVNSNENHFKNIRSDTCYASLFSSSMPEAPSMIASESFFRAIESFYSVYANNFINYLDSNEYYLAKSRSIRKMGPRHDFSKGLKSKLNRLGVRFSFIGSVAELTNVEEDLSNFYCSIFELFNFPGLDNRLYANERLNNMHRKWTIFIKNHPKYIAIKSLAPQD